MYSFAQRADTIVYDEPLFAHFLRITGIDHPGRKPTLEQQENDGNKVIRELIMGPHPRPVALFKQMSHHLVELDESFLQQTANVMLIRDPRAIINSYAKVRPYPTMQDVGFEQQLELFHKLQKWGTLKAVVETKIMLQNPENILPQLCNCLDIPFDAHMLKWEAGARPEDGAWAPYWYDNVHKSTGFKPYVARQYELADHLEELAERCQPYYEELSQHVLHIRN